MFGICRIHSDTAAAGLRSVQAILSIRGSPVKQLCMLMFIHIIYRIELLAAVKPSYLPFLSFFLVSALLCGMGWGIDIRKKMRLTLK